MCHAATSFLLEIIKIAHAPHPLVFIELGIWRVLLQVIPLLDTGSVTHDRQRIIQKSFSNKPTKIEKIKARKALIHRGRASRLLDAKLSESFNRIMNIEGADVNRCRSFASKQSTDVTKDVLMSCYSFCT